jgi:hypothetical protein
MDDMNARIETEFYDETTVYMSVSVDKTNADDPSKLKFLLPDGTELKLELSESTEQADGEPVYEVTGIKKHK